MTNETIVFCEYMDFKGADYYSCPLPKGNSYLLRVRHWSTGGPGGLGEAKLGIKDLTPNPVKSFSCPRELYCVYSVVAQYWS